jgi:hypothetical protein
MQLWDSMCWPHVNPVGKDCQRRLLSRPRFVRACSATDYLLFIRRLHVASKLEQATSPPDLSLLVSYKRALTQTPVAEINGPESSVWLSMMTKSVQRLLGLFLFWKSIQNAKNGFGREAGWAPEPVCTQRQQERSFCSWRGSNLDRPGRPVRSQTLYWLSYPAHN